VWDTEVYLRPAPLGLRARYATETGTGSALPDENLVDDEPAQEIHARDGTARK
jgi:hypothetical protein